MMMSRGRTAALQSPRCTAPPSRCGCCCCCCRLWPLLLPPHSPACSVGFQCLPLATAALRPRSHADLIKFPPRFNNQGLARSRHVARLLGCWAASARQNRARLRCAAPAVSMQLTPSFGPSGFTAKREPARRQMWRLRGAAARAARSAEGSSSGRAGQ